MLVDYNANSVLYIFVHVFFYSIVHAPPIWKPLKAYPTSVDIEELLRSASELRTLDWPNEDPYNPTDSLDKWPPPSPVKRSSMTAPGKSDVFVYSFSIQQAKSGYYRAF